MNLENDVERTEFVKLLMKSGRRCVFLVEKSTPRISYTNVRGMETVFLSTQYILSHGPKRFRWGFKDVSGNVYKGSVRWTTAVFAGCYSPLMQDAFPYSLNEQHFGYDLVKGINHIKDLRDAGIGPVFLRNQNVRKGRLMTRPETANSKVMKMIGFTNEVDAILGAGFLDPELND